ncbi:MAG: DUF4325 domain-containing protein [Candidatus Peregrinibacteria bacterium]
MSLKDLLKFAKRQRKVSTSEIAKHYKVSRQYASRLLNRLVGSQQLIKIGSTRSAFYIHPDHADTVEKPVTQKRFKNKNLKEHEVWDILQRKSLALSSLKENIKSILDYAFTEMLNNAIEHSRSRAVEVSVEENGSRLIFHVNDRGIGVFRNVMRERKLKSEWEAIQDLLKGKTTTKPRAHSGEGIFFTSKIADTFTLESFNFRLIVDNTLPDIFVEELHFGNERSKRGTRVTFSIDRKSKKHLNDVFSKFQTDPEEYAFDKTEIHVKLYTQGTVHVSRSQARRILAGLEKFKLIVLDFDKIPTVGQAFADEIFRVFKNKHPTIKIQPIHMNEAVRFMIGRVRW